LAACLRSAVLQLQEDTVKIAKNRCCLNSKRHFSERVIDRWNRLPQHVIDSASLNAVKSGLDRLRSASIGFITDQWSAKLYRPHLFRLPGIRCSRTWYVPGMYYLGLQIHFLHAKWVQHMA